MYFIKVLTRLLIILPCNNAAKKRVLLTLSVNEIDRSVSTHKFLAGFKSARPTN